MFRRLIVLLRNLVRGQQVEAWLDEELRASVDILTQEGIGEGIDPVEARRRALIELGGIEPVKERVRTAMIGASLRDFAQDLRYGVRVLGRARSFSVAAVLTLALGIGATTAIFSVMDSALRTALPYPDADRLLVLGFTDGGSQDGQVFHYVRDRARGFSRIAAHSGTSGWNLVVGDRAEYVTGVRVSEGFFEVLGATPLLGRAFLAAEDRPGGADVVILSEPTWRRVLGARPDAVGVLVRLGGVPHRVVGIMPAGFRSFPAADLWTPLRVSPEDSSLNYTVLGRLAEDESDEAAARDLAALRPGIMSDLRGISEVRSQGMQWIHYRRWLGLADRTVLLLLFGAVVFLLLIACVNVASLQLIRALARRREFATRSALGGSRVRLARQMLTESLVLAAAGAAVGTGVAWWGIPTLLTQVPEGLLEGRAVVPNWRVWVVTMTLTAGAGVLFGLAPALAVARLDVGAALCDGTRTTSARGTLWVRRGLATAQVTLAMVLLIGAGLFLRTLVNLRAAELGFNPSDVVVGRMSLQGAGQQTSGPVAAFYERTLAEVREIPGVSAAAVGTNVPVEPGVNLALDPPVGGMVEGGRAVDWSYVTAEYFAAFRIPLEAGRTFDARDLAEGVAVAVVNEAFAQTYFGTTQVLGRVVQLTAGHDDPPRLIVGVVGDVKGLSRSGWTRGVSALGTPAAPTLYVPVAQVPQALLQLVHRFSTVNWIVRARGGAEVPQAIQRVVRAAEPRLPFVRFETMDQLVARDLELSQFLTILITAFAVVSLALATIGVYGLMAYAARQRTREVGIRIALGAGRGRVLRGFVGEGLALVIVGGAIGLGAAAIVSQALEAFIVGITPLDPLTFTTVAALLVVVTGIATLVPALEVSRTEPTETLRVG